MHIYHCQTVLFHQHHQTQADRPCAATCTLHTHIQHREIVNGVEAVLSVESADIYFEGGRMRVTGLTGGIACGKSAVSTLLLQAGIPVIDCDKMAHRLMRKVIDMPLLFETGAHRLVQPAVVVSCAPDIQLERLMARDGCGKAEVAAKISSQMPLARKVQLADRIVDNSGSLAELQQQVDQLVVLLKGGVRGWGLLMSPAGVTAVAAFMCWLVFRRE